MSGTNSYTPFPTQQGAAPAAPSSLSSASLFAPANQQFSNWWQHPLVQQALLNAPPSGAQQVGAPALNLAANLGAQGQMAQQPMGAMNPNLAMFGNIAQQQQPPQQASYLQSILAALQGSGRTPSALPTAASFNPAAIPGVTVPGTPAAAPAPAAAAPAAAPAPASTNGMFGVPMTDTQQAAQMQANFGGPGIWNSGYGGGAGNN
jgi:hypothetical protein